VRKKFAYEDITVERNCHCHRADTKLRSGFNAQERHAIVSRIELLEDKISPDGCARLWNAKRDKSVQKYNIGGIVEYVLYCVINGLKLADIWFLTR